MFLPLDPDDPLELGSPRTAASWISSHTPSRRGAFMDALYFDDDAATAALPAWRPLKRLRPLICKPVRHAVLSSSAAFLCSSPSLCSISLIMRGRHCGQRT